MKKKYLYMLPITISVLLFAACDPDTWNLDIAGMFANQSPDTDTRFTQSMEYNEAHGGSNITIVAPMDDYRVYVCTDSHVDSTTHNLDKFVAAYKTDTCCPFAIHLGDLINAQNHYPRFDSSIHVIPAEGTDKPMYKTAGNHDLYFGQWEKFKEYYGTSTYTLTVKTPHATDYFICLDSGSGTLGTKELKWFREVLAAAEGQYRHLIVYTHTHVFKQDASQGHTSNYNMEETYELLGLVEKYGVELILMGHDHNREISRYGHATYIIVDSVQDPQERPYYMILNMGQLDYQFVALPRSTGGLKN